MPNCHNFEDFIRLGSQTNVNFVFEFGINLGRSRWLIAGADLDDLAEIMIFFHWFFCVFFVSIWFYYTFLLHGFIFVHDDFKLQ